MHRLLLAAPLVLVGCADPSPAVGLDELPDLSIRSVVGYGVQSEDPSEVEPRWLSVAISYDGARFRRDHGGACAELDPSLHATFDGVDVPRGEPVSVASDGPDCGGPTFQLRMPAAPGGAVTVADDSHRVDIALDPAALVERTAALPPGQRWRFHAGSRVDLTWSAPGDLVEPVGILLRQGSSANPSTVGVPFTAAGPALQLDLPADARSGELEILPVCLHSAPLRCQGATCSMSVDNRLRHRLVIE